MKKGIFTAFVAVFMMAYYCSGSGLQICDWSKARLWFDWFLQNFP
jgi:hypothetical protein